MPITTVFPIPRARRVHHQLNMAVKLHPHGSHSRDGLFLQHFWY